MQFTRLTPVPTTANDATAEARSAIQRQLAPGSPSSVFNSYRQIDVQWQAQDIAAVPPRASIPLPAGNMIPTDSTRLVANTAMETFVQRARSCLDCHQNAAIARHATERVLTLNGRTIRQVLLGKSKPVGQGPAYAADYSFVFAAETRR